MMKTEPKNIPPVLKHLLTLLTDAAESANVSRLELLLDWISKQVNNRGMTTELRLFARNWLFELGRKIRKEAPPESTWSGIAARLTQVGNEITFRSIEPFAAGWDALSVALSRGNTEEVGRACKMLTSFLTEHEQPEEVYNYLAVKLRGRARELKREPGVQKLNHWAAEWTDRAA